MIKRVRKNRKHVIKYTKSEFPYAKFIAYHPAMDRITERKIAEGFLWRVEWNKKRIERKYQ